MSEELAAPRIDDDRDAKSACRIIGFWRFTRALARWVRVSYFGGWPVEGTRSERALVRFVSYIGSRERKRRDVQRRERERSVKRRNKQRARELALTLKIRERRRARREPWRARIFIKWLRYSRYSRWSERPGHSPSKQPFESFPIAVPSRGNWTDRFRISIGST